MVSCSSESGEYSRRYTGICEGAHDMGGIFGVHCAMVIHGFEWHGRRAGT